MNIQPLWLFNTFFNAELSRTWSWASHKVVEFAVEKSYLINVIYITIFYSHFKHLYKIRVHFLIQFLAHVAFLL